MQHEYNKKIKLTLQHGLKLLARTKNWKKESYKD